MDLPTTLARHRARAPRRAVMFGTIAVLAAALAGLAVGAAGRSSTPVADAPAVITLPRPEPVSALPVPEVSAAVQTTQPCDLPTVTEALAAGDGEGAVAAVGGGAAFRAALLADRLPCVSLSDENAVWFVVNKARPFPQLDWAPGDLTPVTSLPALNSSELRRSTAAALDRMADGARDAGVGEIALLSGYRSFQTQVANHDDQVATQGDAADQSSARAGYSEHQTGMTADIVACNGGCSTMDDFGASAQGRWVAEHGWEYGFVIRYEGAETPVTGYAGEPWHVRYIGVDLARAYHDGGFHTLEDFFGLPAAPDYPG
ncbi:M15 family metallopeptidase [Microbacterium gorillae]|uniref:M15 family metallopeptidase n=1 Tax=Microbacterium gorillae TaxID=1231063 RepID=UPI0006934AB0|nr:M15 family metallopeptidase [Microbacterium gorillae]